jgi:hypothetical protein
MRFARSEKSDLGPESLPAIFDFLTAEFPTEAEPR